MTRRRTDAAGAVPGRQLWKRSVLARYWLLQLPGTLLVVLILLLLAGPFAIPAWMIGAIVALWVVKDALLYPLLWRSYDPGFPSGHTMIGRRGVAAERIDPAGYALVRGERWRAELAGGARPIERGEPVLVETTRGLTLIVRPPARAAPRQTDERD